MRSGETFRPATLIWSSSRPRTHRDPSGSMRTRSDATKRPSWRLVSGEGQYVEATAGDSTDALHGAADVRRFRSHGLGPIVGDAAAFRGSEEVVDLQSVPFEDPLFEFQGQWGTGRDGELDVRGDRIGLRPRPPEGWDGG